MRHNYPNKLFIWFYRLGSRWLLHTGPLFLIHTQRISSPKNENSIISYSRFVPNSFFFFRRIQKENNSKELNWLLFSVELQWMTTKAFKLQSAQRTLKVDIQVFGSHAIDNRPKLDKQETIIHLLSIHIRKHNIQFCQTLQTILYSKSNNIEFIVYFIVFNIFDVLIFTLTYIGIFK